jgi:hypothetical protein
MITTLSKEEKSEGCKRWIKREGAVGRERM